MISRNLGLFARGAVLALAMVVGFAGFAGAFNNDVHNAANRLSQSTDQLVKQLQSFLQGRGQWLPKAGTDEMKACNAMQELQQQANDLKSRAANMNEAELSSTASRLDSNLRTLERRLRRIGADRRLMNQYRNVDSDARQLQNFSSRSSFGAPFGTGYGTGATANPNEVRDMARVLDGNVGRLVSSLQSFLQSRGKWKPPVGSEEMRACQVMEDLKNQSNTLKSQAQGMNSNVLSSNVRQLSNTAGDLRSQLRRIGANGTLMNQMDLVYNDVRQLSSMSGAGDYRDRGYRGRDGYRGRGYDRDNGRDRGRRGYDDRDQYYRGGRGWR